MNHSQLFLSPRMPVDVATLLARVVLARHPCRPDDAGKQRRYIHQWGKICGSSRLWSCPPSIIIIISAVAFADRSTIRDVSYITM